MKVSIVNMMECSLVPCHMCGCGWKSLVHKCCYHKGSMILLLLGYLFGIHATKIWPWAPRIEVLNSDNIIRSSHLVWVGGMLTSFPGDTEFSTACSPQNDSLNTLLFNSCILGCGTNTRYSLSKQCHPFMVAICLNAMQLQRSGVPHYSISFVR